MEALTTDAERLAKAILKATEIVGMQMMAESGGTPNIDDEWTLEGLDEVEREGMVRAAQFMIDRGLAIVGPNA